MIRFRTFSILTALLFPFTTSAQSTSLEPAEGYFSSYNFSHEYRIKVRNILLKGISDKPDAMLVTLASFSPETAIVLSEGELIELKCSKQIWNNDAPEKIIVKKRSIRLSKELAEAVQTLWFDALGSTRYSNERRAGLDGASHYFTSFRVGLGLRAARAWSPAEKSLPSELLRVAHELINLKAGESKTEKKLLSEVRAIHATIIKKEKTSADQSATASEAKSKGSSPPPQKPKSEERSY
ncbi:MAG: hypothetical protein ACSHX6_05215 [Akkermansiaceae bacterium]